MLFRSDRKSTRLNSSHLVISYAVFCLKKKKTVKKTGFGDRRKAILEDMAVFTCDTVRSEERGYKLETSDLSMLFFFFNDTATTEIYTLSLHDALPILESIRRWWKLAGRHRKQGAK